MPLQTDRKPATADLDASGVSFGMLDGAQPARCWVSGTALRDVFGAEESIASMNETFNTNRHRIENMASRKYDRRILVRGVVQLMTADFV